MMIVHNQLWARRSQRFEMFCCVSALATFTYAVLMDDGYKFSFTL